MCESVNDTRMTSEAMNDEIKNDRKCGRLMCGYNPHAIDKVLQLLVLGFGDLLDFAVGFPTVENHTDSIVLNRLTFTRTKFDEVGSCELVG